MKILITGAGGQLGHALCDEYADENVLALKHADLDISETAAVRSVLKAEQPDLLINAAAYTDVDGAESHQDLAFRVNAEAVQEMAQLSRELDIPLLHFSTDYVFDGRKGTPYTEDDMPHPLSRYGISKLAGEKAIRDLYPAHYIVRTSWLFHTAGKNFLKTMLDLSQQEEIRVVNDQVGSPTYAPHLARAVRYLQEAGDFGTWHLAGSGATSWFGLTRRLFAELDIDTVVVPVTTDHFSRPAPRPACSALATTRGSEFELPPWEAGVQAFAEAIVAAGGIYG